ncbi:putative Trypsin-like serine protease [Vibrio nigripulchritudo SOn1]|uniref:Trypsin-like serine protease n=1 Tax=Vibrio nigripulchritudo SOn1 TaxID=1238450 RepID=A0AAV2VNE1_9VIBR|nr:aspartyl protease family protein [Vibrio nigripulchritudo]CCO46231.1 putative Trypsin-like serine protease [Vibrio nigripulchritudo SOn1]
MKLLQSKTYASLSVLLGIGLVSGCSSLPTETSHDPVMTASQPSSDALIVPVVIDGKRYHFLLDTGASVTFIDPDVARQITKQVSLDTFPPILRRDFGNITGVSGVVEPDRFSFFEPVEMSIGDKVIHDHDLWIGFEFDVITEGNGIQIDGILGADTFRKLTWLKDNRSNQLFAYDYALNAADFQQCVGYSDTYNRAPWLVMNYEDLDVTVMTDTGATDSRFGEDFIQLLEQETKSIYQNPEPQLSYDANGFKEEHSYIVKDLYFEGMPLGEIEVSANISQYAVGMDFFSRFDRFAFMPNKLMFCYDASSIEETWQQPERLIYVRFSNEQLEIFYNPEDRLTQYGLQNGDVVLEANGKHYKPNEIRQLGDLIRTVPKGELTMKVRRNGKELTIEI